MTTVRDICTRSLRRNNILASGEAMSAADGADALGALNDMMHAWNFEGVGIPHEDFALTSTFEFFVPPEVRIPFADTFGSHAMLANLDYRGAWDASANSPALASSAGTEGHLYKVSTAGSTALDATTSWAVDDYLIFNRKQWVKGRSSRPFEGAVIAMLAVRMSSQYGDDVTPELMKAADDGWNRILQPWLDPDAAKYDFGLTRTSVRLWRESGINGS